jgi:hypothetical protein
MARHLPKREDLALLLAPDLSAVLARVTVALEALDVLEVDDANASILAASKEHLETAYTLLRGRPRKAPQ